MDDELRDVLMKHADQLQHWLKGRSPQIVIFNINSPVTVNTRGANDNWLERKLRIFERSSVRIAACLISLAALAGIVAHEVGMKLPFTFPTVGASAPALQAPKTRLLGTSSSEGASTKAPHVSDDVGMASQNLH